MEGPAHEFTRLVRWGIPGWVATLAFAAFALIDNAIETSGQRNLFTPIGDFISGHKESLGALALLAIAAAIPLGFLIYQGYYYLRWNSPMSKNGFLSPFVLGRMDDLEKLIRLIPKDKMPLSYQQWRLDITNSGQWDTDHRYRWLYIDPLLGQTMQEIDSRFAGASSYARYRYIHELMHVLGASLAGLYLGFVCYLGLKTSIGGTALLDHGSLTVLSLGLLLYLMKEDTGASGDPSSNLEPANKRHSFVSQLARWFSDSFSRGSNRLSGSRLGQWFGRWFGRWFQGIRQHWAEAFLTFLGLLLLCAIPSLRNSLFPPKDWWDVVAGLVMAFATVFIWRSPANVDLGSSMLPFAMLFGILAGLYSLAGVFRTGLLLLDWPYVVASYVFLVGNLVIVKNRENVRDHLVALQYYALSRYLSTPSFLR